MYSMAIFTLLPRVTSFHLKYIKPYLYSILSLRSLGVIRGY